MKRKSESHSLTFWGAAAIGGTICLYGLHGLVGALHGIRSRQFLQWFVGADIAHDLIVAPAACLIGAAIARLVHPSARAHVRAGLFATAVILAIAWAPLHAYGHATAPGNSSVEPLNYATAVPTVLIAVWALVGCWFTITMLQRRPARQPGTASHDV
jgi:hypothetical protein